MLVGLAVHPERCQPWAKQRAGRHGHRWTGAAVGHTIAEVQSVDNWLKYPGLLFVAEVGREGEQFSEVLRPRAPRPGVGKEVEAFKGPEQAYARRSASASSWSLEYATRYAPEPPAFARNRLASSVPNVIGSASRAQL